MSFGAVAMIYDVAGRNDDGFFKWLRVFISGGGSFGASSLETGGAQQPLLDLLVLSSG